MYMKQKVCLEGDIAYRKKKGIGLKLIIALCFFFYHK